jgi:Cft2 family RNA processing exonuclease
MFHYDGGLKLTKADLAIDFNRRQPRAFISHAHSDHMARHELALCTPATARLYQHRLGKRPTMELAYRTPIEWGGLRLTTYPAGHCLGSAMLLADDGRQTLLYTGDFKLGPSATSETAELPHADILVMECTFGRPAYRMIPRREAIEQLVGLVREALLGESTPVVHAYTLGKSQEVSRLLCDAGFPVLQHRDVFAVSEVYRACGVNLGNVRLYPGRPLPGHVVVAPPARARGSRLPGLRQTTTFAVTGWASDSRARYRLGVDHAIPLSDHADFDQLLEAARQVAPQVIYCTHGPESFVEHLRDEGFDAHPLGKSRQGRLFH